MLKCGSWPIVQLSVQFKWHPEVSNSDTYTNMYIKIKIYNLIL